MVSVVTVSGQLAVLCFDFDDVETPEINLLPVEVCALLAKLLPPAGRTLVWRKEIAARLELVLSPQTISNLTLSELAAAIDGLKTCSADRIDGRIIAHFASRLVACELTVGGPYCNKAGEADIVCNAWVSQCLRWLAEPLPNVDSYLRSALDGYGLVDPEDIAAWAMVHSINGDQHFDQYAPLVIMALSVRVFYDCHQHLGADNDIGGHLAGRVHDYSRNGLPAVAEPFSGYTRQMLEQVISADSNHEISRLAEYFGGALAAPVPWPQDLYVQLGAANLYAWAAYTIYDDFLDDEGCPPLLATANFSLRAMLRHYRLAMHGQPAYQQFVEATLTAVDQANALETSRFRFGVKDGMLYIWSLPDYGDCDMLADRALFHILGPMAVLCASGRAKVGDASWQGTLQAFRHYLIARQLNDDIHDWAKDLQAGQASYVVVELLRYLNIQAGNYRLAELLPYAKRQFWQYVLPQICEVALRHIQKARQCLLQSTQVTSANKLLDLFDYVERSMRAAQAKRFDGQLLLQAFRQSV